MRIVLCLPLISAALLATGASAAPGVLVCHFDTHDLAATVNDFGATTPEVSGFALSPEGAGCPADPIGRALDAGFSTSSGHLMIPFSPETSVAQGALEFWIKPAWDFGDRAIRNLLTLPMRGGMWNSIGVCYHGLMGPETEVFESNIMDGLDHPLAVVTGPETLMWHAGEWHHVALSWTEHSQRLFADGKLIGSATYEEPLQFTQPVGKLYVGCSSTGLGTVAAALIDELRLCTLPLYAGMDRIQVPTARLPDRLPEGLALAAEGATCMADSEAPAWSQERDEPLLHDGRHGETCRIGRLQDTGDATVELTEAATIAGITWSRDGRAFSGPEGQGWARADSLPRDFCVEVSSDKQTWREVARVERFTINPGRLAKMTAARFPVSFEPITARFVRLRITGNTTAAIGQWPLLDEITLQRTDGTDAPIAMVSTERTRLTRQYSAAKAIDGRIGEESCWKSATPGRGELTVALPEVRRVSAVSWSRSREGLDSDGVPVAVTVEVSADGQQFSPAGAVGGITSPGTATLQIAPCRARFVRLSITATVDGKEPVIDEIQVR